MEYFSEVVVTGASGFIGQHVCDALQQNGFLPRRLTRRLPQRPDPSERWVAFNYENEHAANVAPFVGANAIIHLAARAHIMSEAGEGALSEYLKANLEGTKKIAQLAVRSGVKRLVFVSSIGVNGTTTRNRYAFDEYSVPNPVEDYALSKYLAELALVDIAKEEGLEYTIVRPPLVYGPGNPGNFLRLLRLVQSGYPLPLGSVRNSRSFIYVDNLASALVECITNPAAANKTYLVSDGHDISTADLVREVALCMECQTRIIPFPVPLLKGIGHLMKKSHTIDKLISSLVVDSSRIRRELGWTPPVTFHDGIKETVAWFARSDSHP